ncbi:MAG: riboflavin synthase [Casimicrobiaceae bacterium]
MFTGIVQAVGRIAAAERKGDGMRLAVDTGVYDVADVGVGESIAVNGCCLTVVEVHGATLQFDVSAETLRCATGLDRVGDVNLERAMQLSDRLGGHLMTGHVDGIGTVVRCEPVGEPSAPVGEPSEPKGEPSGSTLLEVEVPAALARFIAPKGSIAIHGVSLTVNAVDDTRLAVNLIPHTLAATNLKRLTPGDRVNLEIDLIARYVERMFSYRG